MWLASSGFSFNDTNYEYSNPNAGNTARQCLKYVKANNLASWRKITFSNGVGRDNRRLLLDRQRKINKYTKQYMKSTTEFKNIIKNYLDNRAKEDELFAESYKKEGKNIDDCITYILNTVQKSGCNGFADEEIYSMAVHYYDEEKIDIGGNANCKVVVNRTIELTEEEKEQARKDALKKYQDDIFAEIKRKSQKPAKKSTETEQQPSLFD